MNIWKQGWCNWKHPISNINNFFNCIKYSYQRIVRGYSDYDVWNLYDYLTNIIADSVECLANTTTSYPVGKTYDEWVKYLKDNVELIRHSKDDYFYHNEYEENMLPLYDKWTTEENENGTLKLVTHYTDDEEVLNKKFLNKELEIDKLKKKDFEIGMMNLISMWFNLWD